MNINDDGRRHLPKMKCPYCYKRFGDLPNRELKNRSKLVTKDQIVISKDIVLQCPHCHNFVGLRIENIEKIYFENNKYFA